MVECWIGAAGVRDAAVEFNQGGYRYIVASGGLTGDRWSEKRWSYVEAAERILLQSGVPPDRIIPASSGDFERQRTYEMAVAARQALLARGIEPRTINVFTREAHARRSRLVFSKAFGSAMNVGVISWAPPGYNDEPWWHSSERAEDFLKETVGYAFELFLNSGREFHFLSTPAGKPTVETAPRPL